MHGFDFSLIGQALTVVAIVLAVCVLAFVIFVPRIRGNGAIGLGYTLGLIAVVAAVVVIVLGGAQWMLG